MKCPSCSSKISFLNVRNEFSCPNCKARIRMSNGGFALIIAALCWFVFSLLMITIFKGELAGTIIDLTFGTLISFIIFTRIMKLERIG